MVGHLNGFLAGGGGNLNTNFSKIQVPGMLPWEGMLKLRFDWCINIKGTGIPILTRNRNNLSRCSYKSGQDRKVMNSLPVDFEF